MKTKKSQIFYSVNACSVVGGACLSRGMFAALSSALDAARAFPEWEVWRHEDRAGIRIENRVVAASFAAA